ncbi:hypothetical protein TNCV_1794941 [Trichonephila clavipes]|nr:hypothetical protein TNCV_1794941 [Trichonephila clavipes]
MNYPAYTLWEKLASVFQEIKRTACCFRKHPQQYLNLAEYPNLDLSIEPNLTAESCIIIEEINSNSDLCIKPDSTTESHQESRPNLKPTSELSNAEPNLTTHPSTVMNLKFEEINMDSSEYLTANDLMQEIDYNETLNLLRNMEPFVLIEGLPL